MFVSETCDSVALTCRCPFTRLWTKDGEPSWAGLIGMSVLNNDQADYTTILSACFVDAEGVRNFAVHRLVRALDDEEIDDVRTSRRQRVHPQLECHTSGVG